MGLIGQIKKYLAFGLIGIKETMLYPMNLIARIVVHLVRVGVYILIYQYLVSVSSDGTLGGLTLIEASFSVAVVQILGQSCRYVYKEIRDDVRVGNISVKFNKPYNYINSLIVKSFVEGLFKMLVFYLITVFFLYIVLGLPSISISLILWIIAVSILGLFLNILIEVMIGLTSFWVENPDPVYWVTNRSAWIVNGMMIPVALLPQWAKSISTYYPLSISYVVGRAFEINFNHILTFVVLIAWIILMLFLIKIIFKKAQEKVTIHGG